MTLSESEREWNEENGVMPFDKVNEKLHAEIIDLGHWDVHPLAAYTPNDMLIHPSNYEKELAGSVVMMTFRLKYALPWNSNTKKYKKVQCTTEILQIQVVTKFNPISCMNTASKHAAPLKPKFGSPVKKQVK